MSFDLCRAVSPGALRQYHRPAVVQAAQIIQRPGPLSESVKVTDVTGLCSVITHTGLFKDGVPEIGDWVLLWPGGVTTWVSAGEFAAEWAPMRGSVLS